MIIAIIAFVVALLLLVVAHEWGHYIVARKAGVTVHEFSVGMGKRLLTFGKDSHGTIFNLRAFPIGGYVRIKGESPGEKGALTQADSFIRAPFWWKVAILLWGIAMNVIVARVIFTIGLWYGVKPIQILPDNVMKTQSRSYLMPSYSFLEEKWYIPVGVQQPAKIMQVWAEWLAKGMGMRIGDVIETINGKAISTMTIQHELQQNIGKGITLRVRRGSGEQTLQAMCPGDSCLLGVLLDTWVPVVIAPIKMPLGRAMIASVGEIKQQVTMTLRGLGGIVSTLFTKNRGQAVQKLSGPIGAAKVGQFVIASWGWMQFVMFAGMLSLALAVFNLLPIPALDGWRLLGVIIQKVGRLQESKYYEIEWYINTLFFVLMLVLGVFIMLQDLVRARWVKIPGLGG
jgi:regulator of sigma E protease